jgi:hypothetical protein
MPPRARQSMMGTITPAKRGRPVKRKKKATELEDVTITPVANGYTVTSRTTGRETFVFNDFDKMTEFIQVALKPTTETKLFVDSI